MRIGFDAKRAFNNNTGLGNYSRFVIEALLQYAPDNDYFLYSPKVSESNKFYQSVKAKSEIKNPKTKNPLWRSWLINNDLQKDKIDIFHGLSNEIPFGIGKTNVKSIVTIHDLIFLRYPKLYPAIDRWIYNQKFKYACQNADVVIAVSQQTKRDIIDFYRIKEDKVRVVYQGITTPPIPLQSSSKNEINKYILCVATIAERKNQLTLVKAFEALNLPDYELVLVGGKTSYQTQIEEYIAQRKLQNIRILNNVSFEELPNLYANADLFVYPSIFEGFGIPIIEAFQYNLPVVAATGSCLEEAGGSGAIYANPLEYQDLAEKMSQVLNNLDLYNQLIINGKEHLKQFSKEKIASDLNMIYKAM